MTNRAEKPGNKESPGDALSGIPPFTPSVSWRRKAQRRDRLATAIIRTGGVMVILCVLGILLLILNVTLPLFSSPQASLSAELPPLNAETMDIALDDTLQSLALLTREGQLEYYELSEQRDAAVARDTIRLPVSPPVRSVVRSNRHPWTLVDDDGIVRVFDISVGYRFDTQGRRIPHRGFELLWETDPHPGVEWAQVSLTEEGAVVARRLAGGRVLIDWVLREENFMGEIDETRDSAVFDGLPPEAPLALSQNGRRLAVGTDQGFRLLDLVESGSIRELPGLLTTPVSTLTWLMGGESLALGLESGELVVSFGVNDASAETGRRWVEGHRIRVSDTALVRLVSSPRWRGVVAGDADGTWSLIHTTSERTLVTLDAGNLSAVALNGRGLGCAGMTPEGRMTLWSFDVPHPETTSRTLFASVWYEGYPERSTTWQSTGGTDDFESKMSLTPLIWGTFKAAIYAMLFAVPFGLFGAIYTSQFASDRFKRRVKPMIELMGAVPTVVIGFLAALWLAPKIDDNLAEFLSSIIVFPICILFWIAVWSWIRGFDLVERLERRREWLWCMPAVGLGLATSYVLGPIVEASFWGGNVQQWVFETTGAPYEQRNSLIIAVALGFTVLPIVFTMAEDALSSVPRAIPAASLALGASRWQTTWRVVMPSAASGIIAGVILGLARAVGETMIVLMATGNTPVMSASAFNGMRTLSANIAVEIPEAPHGGTLYRVLFLSAVVLFLFTSVLNTAAELIRRHINKKLGKA